MTVEKEIKQGHEQIAFIHILRGVAILLVVWSHFSGWWLQTSERSSVAQDFWQKWVVAPFHIYQNGGHLAVILFFLVSGYIITFTSLKETRIEFFVKRILRIFPILIVGSLIAWGIAKYGAPRDYLLIGEGDASVKRWVSSMFLLDGFRTPQRMVSVTWTLFIEMAFYTFTFILLYLSKKKVLLSTWLMLGIYVLTYLLMTKVEYFAQSPNSAAISYTAFLIIGRAIYLWNKKLVNNLDSFLIAFTALFIFFLFAEEGSTEFLFRPGGWAGAEPFVTYIGGILIFLVCLRWSPKKVFKPLAFIADISYSLYILHVPVGMLVLNYMTKQNYPYSLHFIIAVVATIAISYITYHLIELPARNTGRKFLKYLKTRSINNNT